jgi:hypothetical protein
MYVCMYVCVCVCMYVRTYVRTYECMYVCTYYVCIYVCMYVRTYVCVCVCMYVIMYVCAYIRVLSVCIHILGRGMRHSSMYSLLYNNLRLLIRQARRRTAMGSREVNKNTVSRPQWGNIAE